MEQIPLNVLGVVGSLNSNSVTRVVVNHVLGELARKGCRVDIFDPLKEPLDLFNPDSAYSSFVEVCLLRMWGLGVTPF